MLDTRWRSLGRSETMRRCLIACAFLVSCVAVGAAQLRETFFDSLNNPAIQCGRRPTADPVAALERRLSAGDTSLTYDATRVSVTCDRCSTRSTRPSSPSWSVYSDGRPVCSPALPRSINPLRAIDFNAGRPWPSSGPRWRLHRDGGRRCAPGRFVSAMLEQQSGRPPGIVRPSACLTCHHSYATGGVPGPLIRSPVVATGPRWAHASVAGKPHDRSCGPFGERWGGFSPSRAAPKRSDIWETASSRQVRTKQAGRLEASRSIRGPLSR